ncbi:hypothetical protein [Blastococcus atacamensis]|uniref:hypothetical protein n=1 Tax=Blastococcus atacamensis TaxID=2070508 RepID=UPI0012FFF309|nr:hypothetical protein [Blastococcus atacamensis]
MNQSVSFASSAGTVSSRRPQASESSTTTLYNPASQGVPVGKEWRLLWLRAVNCEAAPRLMEFFVHQESPTQTALAKFVQGDVWRAGQPNRAVAVAVPANGGQLSWVENRGEPLILAAGQSIGARWYGMVGGARSCNWQYGAIEQPAGTGIAATSTSLPTATVGASFKGDVAGLRSSWRTVPAGTYWLPTSVRATNCETGPRRMDIVLLGPGNIMQGVVTSAVGGSGPVEVPAGGTWTWTASESSSRLLLPEGWGLGVRWLDMRGDAPTGTCSWSATVSVGAMGGTAAAFDSSMG